MAKPKKNTQAWAITYADMVTLLLTFFVLLMVILSEAEKQIDLQIQKLLDNTGISNNENFSIIFMSLFI